MMKEAIQSAILLRNEAQYQASRDILENVLLDYTYRAAGHLHMAWSYDKEGNEKEAIIHYIAALKGPISKTEKFDVLFGLGCTYRSLGEYDNALIYFEKTLVEYPNSEAVMPFYAMCLYNLGRSKEAIELLLGTLVDTTNSDEIKAYKKAILYYATDLDKVC